MSTNKDGESELGAWLAVSHQQKPIDTAEDREKAERILRLRQRQMDLERLLEGQIRQLENLGCPLKIRERFKDDWPEILQQLMAWIMPSNYLAALPVIPRPAMPIEEQMMMVSNGHLTGYTELEPANISDIVAIPEKPYYLIGVEDGRSMLLETPKQAGALIRGSSRLELVGIEAIALARHSTVLQDHGIYAVGSSFQQAKPSGGKVIALGLDGKGRPQLDWALAGIGQPGWGTPSCLRRI